jgi:outer membrane PBP1 activator LpoA protein
MVSLRLLVILTIPACQVTPPKATSTPTQTRDGQARAVQPGLPADIAQRNAAVLSAAERAEAELRYEDAATTLMTYTFSARYADPQNAAVVDRIWSDVNQTPAHRVAALAAQSGHDDATAWWQLADALQRSFDLNAERTAIANWKRSHPEHPASRWPPHAFALIESGVTAPSRVALLLPLSGPLQNAGQAVRDGFVAAFFHAESPVAIRIYDTNGAAVVGLYEQACSDGAQLVVGPLDKSGVTELNAAPNRQVPILALNYLPTGATASAGLFQFGLAIEDEAHAIARRIYDDGLRRVAIIESDLDWSIRAAEAFRSQFDVLGGTVVSVGIIEDIRAVTDVVGNTLLVEASTERMEALARTIGSKPEFIARGRTDLDALVALTDPAQSRALKSAMAFHFAADVPIYATSQVVGAAAPGTLGELDGIRLTELPWRVQASAIRSEVESSFANARSTLSPLYAFGVDAFRLSGRTELLIPDSPGRLLGETGVLKVQSTGAIAREPGWAIVKGGTLVAIPSLAR